MKSSGVLLFIWQKPGLCILISSTLSSLTSSYLEKQVIEMHKSVLMSSGEARKGQK